MTTSKKIKHASELEVARLLYKVGDKLPSGDYCVAFPRDKQPEFDGRICFDEYEELPSYARCLVTAVIADEARNTVSFRATTGFSTHFPAQDNFDFNLCILPKIVQDYIYEYLTTLPVKHKKASFKTEWKNRASQYLDMHNWPGHDNHPVDFEFSVDCWLCCDNELFGIDKVLPRYDAMMQLNTMIAIKIVYPDIDVFMDKMYLSKQTTERRLILKKFIERIMFKVWNTIPDSFINELYKKDPVDVLLKRNKSFFIFKQPPLIEPAKEITKPSSHKIKDTYTSSDYREYQVRLHDLWIGATYLFQTQTGKEDIFTPVKLINVEFTYRAVDMNRCLEAPRGCEIAYSNYFGKFGGDDYGEAKIFLTLENLRTSEQFKFRYSEYGAFVQEDGTYSYLHELKPPYKYPTIENTFIKEQCSDVLKKCNTAIKAYAQKQRPKHKPKWNTIEINGLQWVDHNITLCKNDYFEKETHYQFRYGDIFSLIPKGYRLPTAKEFQDLLVGVNFDKNRDSSVLENGIKINIMQNWYRVSFGFWTSDTYTGEFIDPVKIVVTLGGCKKAQTADEDDNMLLLIKE